jgi:hypothetical protein
MQNADPRASILLPGRHPLNQAVATLFPGLHFRSRAIIPSFHSETHTPGRQTPPVLMIDARVLLSLPSRPKQEKIPKKPKINPWRNFKFGKPHYQRPQHPRN